MKKLICLMLSFVLILGNICFVKAEGIYQKEVQSFEIDLDTKNYPDKKIYGKIEYTVYIADEDGTDKTIAEVYYIDAWTEYNKFDQFDYVYKLSGDKKSANILLKYRYENKIYNKVITLKLE